MNRSCVIQTAVALILMVPTPLFAREDRSHPTSDTPSQAQVSEAYVCPMHPEVRADQPGRCPKCQMALEPVHKEEGMTVGAGAHQDHGSKRGGILSMIGDYHIELVERDTEYHLYLYDAFTEPLSSKDVSGKLVHLATEQTAGQAEVSETWLPLIADPTHTYLVAAKVPGPQPEEVTVLLQLNGEEHEITLPLRVTLEGKVVDVACFAKDGMAALTRQHDECAKQCLLAGSPVGILVGEDANAPLYLVTLRGDGASSRAANDRLLGLASRKVRVTGRLIQRSQLTILELQDVKPLD